MSSQKTFFDFDDTNRPKGNASFNKIQFNQKMIDKGTSLSFIRFIYQEEISEETVDEESQIRESLCNLKSGNYTDFTIEEYLKELDK